MTSPIKVQECFHCGLPVTEVGQYTVDIQDETHEMCCAGCQAVAQAIVNVGREDFYQHRTGFSNTPQDTVPEFLQQLSAYDHPDVQKHFVHHCSENEREASLILEGIVCSACVWLNEQHLATLSGVLDVKINYSTHRALVLWDDSIIKLSEILGAITKTGYQAHPYDVKTQQDVFDKTRKQYLRRLGISAVLGMQIMVLAVALYTGAWWGMDQQVYTVFRSLSLMLTIPILFFAATPFWKNAWRDIRYRKLGMDVPISLGLLVSFVGSVHATWQGHGEVYFDSISMFVFFVLGVRYFEFMARKKTSEATESILNLRPNMATRIEGQQEKLVPVTELNVEDKVLIRAGETVPADGVITEGKSYVDEALLTGESQPLPKQIGDDLIGGSVNHGSPLTMRVTKVGEETVLSSILRLLEHAQSEKPKISQLADRIATWFVSIILILATSVAVYYGWYAGASEQWLAIVVSVLVVSCPCALSLATPAAMTIASGSLGRLGLLSRSKHALERLANVDHFIFDKTGTLTQGKLKIASIPKYRGIDKFQALQLAIALEKSSEHPIAKAFTDHPDTDASVIAEYVHSEAGSGIYGKINGEYWYLGNAEFIAEKTQQNLTKQAQESLDKERGTVICLANRRGDYALFILCDEIRAGAEALIHYLQRSGKHVSLLSGDHYVTALQTAKKLGIPEDHVQGQLSPDDKLAYLKDLQEKGVKTAMVGDGINDAPVLAGAQVSIAMGSGTQLAAASADMILLSDNLEQLAKALTIPKRTLSVIRQNLMWALVYNFTAIPLAMMGYIPPWVAAIGMSLSSLIVVVNSLRLRKLAK